MEIAYKVDFEKCYEDITKLTEAIGKLEQTSKGVKFLTPTEIKNSKILDWDLDKIRQLFNQPDFPACDYGKEKVVELNAFINYFSVRRDRKNLVRV